jgi:riboflavin kinase/FMN adenylyltransferase
MLLFKSLDELHCQFTNVSLALGTFDGVHLAHRFVIGRTIAWSKLNQGTSMVFTFANHPLSVIHPRRVPPQLQNLTGKTEQIRKLGVDVLVRIPFTKELLHLSPDDFVRLLACKINPRHIVVGPNYSFGDKGAGTPGMLTGLAEYYNIETEICPEVIENSVMVSSTVIRTLLSNGEVAAAANLLGRPYELTGMVVRGDQRGRTLGFPTANMKVSSQLLVPGKGVYAVRVKVGGSYYNGLCNIGVNPTFGQETLRIETHILNFDRDIYGKRLAITFLGRLRGEQKFPSADALAVQMKNDLANATNNYFAG